MEIIWYFQYKFLGYLRFYLKLFSYQNLNQDLNSIKVNSLSFSMIAVNLQYLYGSIRLELKLEDKMQTVLQRIGGKIHVDPKYLSLYFDDKFERRINDRCSVLNARIPNKQTIYLKCNCTIPKVNKICQLTEKRDIYTNFLNDKSLSAEQKRILSEFGPNTVTSEMIEHFNAKKPHVSFQPESSCYAFRVGIECLKRFQDTAIVTGFSTHRIGFLFGRIDEITGKVTAHAMVEPSQDNRENRVVIFNKPELEDAREIASFFGMSCVGMVISHLPNDRLPMTSYMVELAAYYQNFYGEYFTTLIVTPQSESSIQIEAFQVSDAAMKISMNDSFLEDYDDPQNCHFKEDVYVCHEKKRECQANLFLCAVRIRETQSKFLSHQFPSMAQNPNRTDVKLYLKELECTPTWYRLFDLNLLLYLLEANILTLNEIKICVDCILQMVDIPTTIWRKIELCSQ